MGPRNGFPSTMNWFSLCWNRCFGRRERSFICGHKLGLAFGLQSGITVPCSFCDNSSRTCMVYFYSCPALTGCYYPFRRCLNIRVPRGIPSLPSKNLLVTGTFTSWKSQVNDRNAQPADFRQLKKPMSMRTTLHKTVCVNTRSAPLRMKPTAAWYAVKPVSPVFLRWLYCCLRLVCLVPGLVKNGYDMDCHSCVDVHPDWSSIGGNRVMMPHLMHL